MADNRVEFYDTTMRDGAQSLWAMRMTYGAHDAISSELDEILSLSDRIAVMFEGEILATVPAETATKERLGLLMAGVREEVPVQAVS